MTWLWSKLTGYAAAAGLVVAVLGGAYLKGRSDSAARASAQRAEDRIQSMKIAKEVDDEVSNLRPDDVDARLDRWLRDRERRFL